MNKPNCILVTGGAGFIGSNFVKRMIGERRTVINIDKLTYAGNPISLRDVDLEADYRFEQIDIVDRKALRQLFTKHQPDAVVHLAAESHVDRSIDGPSVFIQTNLVGTCHLLEAASEYYHGLGDAKASSFRFLHVSTDEVFGALDDCGSFDENSKYAPRSPYSASKAGADHLVRAWFHTYGLPTIVTNCSNNFGPFQFPEKLIPVVILNSLHEKPIPVFGKGENVRDWIFVEDHCAALSAVLDEGIPGQTYCIGGGNESQNIEVVRQLTAILDELRPRRNGSSYDQLITFVEDRRGHDFRYAIDNTKIRQELAWKPQRNFEDALRETVQWYLENEDWWTEVLSRKDQPS